MTLSISRKGLILVAVPLLFQIAFVSAVIVFQQAQGEAEYWADHSKDVIALANEIRTDVADVEASARGYVIARLPSFADDFRRTSESLSARLDALGGSVVDNPGQADRARAVRRAVEDVVGWQKGLVALVEAEKPAAAKERVASGGGEKLGRAFRREYDGFVAEERRLDRDRSGTLTRSRARLTALVGIGGAAIVAGTVALAVAFQRRVARRFVALESTARSLAEGTPLPAPLAGDDEIAHLDRAFRDMAAELSRTVEAYRDLYDHAPCGYHSVDPSGTFVAVNRTEARWLGYTVEELVGRRRFAEFVAPTSRDAYLAGFARVREYGATSNLELDLIRKDGTTFPVLVGSSSVRDADGRYLRSRTTLTDLTERKRAEAATRLFADVTQNIPVGLLIYRLDESGDPPGVPPVLRVRSGNAGASRLLGVSLDEAAGRPVAEVFPAVPDDQLRRYAAVAAGGGVDDLGEFRYGDERVAERWWAVQAFALPDRSVGVAFQDVTERRRAQDEVRRLNRELEGRVRERTADLEAANHELAQKNAENEMFVYSVSHDLRSPLVNLQGFSKELEKAAGQLSGILAEAGVPPDVRERCRGLLDGKVARSVGFIRTAVLRLSGIIDALLRLSRAGRVEYRWEAVDVGRLVRQVVDAAQATVAEKGATVRVGELPFAWGDGQAVEQVFGNLIGNALAYLDPARPGDIEVGTVPTDALTDGLTDGPTDSPCGTPGKSVVNTYFVRDNGLGIADGHRAKIFQAFQRAHPGVGGGEGLGLAIVARVVERHRGRVWVESAPGVGSTFFVSLPAARGGGGSSGGGR